MANKTGGKNMARDAKKETAWKKDNTTIVTMRLQNSTDADIIAWINTKQSKQGAIKQAIREQIAREQATTE